MSQSSPPQNSADATGSNVLAYVLWGLFFFGGSGYLMVTGMREIQTQEAVITHKNAPSEHVFGERAKREGIKNVVLGGVMLVLGSFGVMKQLSAAMAPPTSEPSSETAQDAPKSSDDPPRTDTA